MGPWKTFFFKNLKSVLIDKHFDLNYARFAIKFKVFSIYIFSFRENTFNMCPIEVLRNRGNPLTH